MQPTLFCSLKRCIFAEPKLCRYDVEMVAETSVRIIRSVRPKVAIGEFIVREAHLLVRLRSICFSFCFCCLLRAV